MNPSRLSAILASGLGRLVALVLLGTSFTAVNARAASDPAVPGEILLRLGTSDLLAPLVAKYNLTVLDRFGARPIFRVAVAPAGMEATMEALQLEPGVVDAEPNFLHAAPEARKNNAWAIGSPTAYAVQWMPAAIRLAEAQRASLGEGVRIAVLDTGVDATHPALQGRLLPGIDLVDNDLDPSEVRAGTSSAFGHGTHVAGIVALVAPAARILPLRVLDAEGRGNAWVLADAILRAVDPDGDPATDDGAHVVNLSLGSLSRTHLMDAIARLAACALVDPEEPQPGEFDDVGYGDDRQRCRISRGAVVVAAAGNDASGSVKEYPAAEGAYGLVAIGASMAGARLAPFSNYGSWVHVAAPGDGITSSVPDGLFGTWSGTSMAAPVASGIVALARALDRTARPEALVVRLKRFSSGLCSSKLRQVDAAAMLANAAPPAPVCP